MSADNGGPVYPNPELGKTDFGDASAYPGMTLLDYFAGQALAGLSSAPEHYSRMGLPCFAYEIAVAMLAEKKRREAQ